ncbi:MAG: CoxG family protein [Sphingomonadaceae bacterium]
MPSVEHDRIVAAPFSRVWPFVRDMDNWAPLVTGYQRHEKLSDTESVWHLKGELGGLTRIAEFKALVTEWDESGKVSFTLQGVNEPVTGEGHFVASELTDAMASEPAQAPERQGFFGRMIAALARFVYGRIFGARDAAAQPSPAQATMGETRIIFTLTLTAGGMAGPVLNMLITPMLKPVAQDLADGIARQIESGRA